MSQTCECALNLPTSTFCRKLCQRFWLFFVGRIHMNLPVCKSKLLLLLWATNNVAWSKQPLKLLRNEATMFCSFSFTFFHKCFILFFLNKIFSWQSIKLNPGAHGSDSGGSGGREGVGGGYCHISLTYLNKGHCTISRFETVLNSFFQCINSSQEFGEPVPRSSPSLITYQILNGQAWRYEFILGFLSCRFS